MGARTNRAGRVVWQAVTPAGNGSAWRFDNTGPAGAGAGAGYWLGNAGAGNVVIPNTTPAGAPYGTALAAEADPVALADVPANRRLAFIPNREGFPNGSGVISARIYGYGVAAGTMSYNAFIYDAFSARWSKFATAVAGTFGATQLLTFSVFNVNFNFYGSLCAITINANAAGAPYFAVVIA